MAPALQARLARTASRFAIGAVLAVSVGGGAAAQEQAAEAEDDSEAIVVTGIRASLDSSAKLKRQSITIVESVSAEDIGKLPDVSIADSLARLPGVTAQRLEGRDQRLSIRGLGPDFGVTLLNGREQVTVGDNRGVEYDQYPSEFFKNVVVHKSANAALLPAGISGTVDLRMLRPLDQPERVIAVQARGQMNGQKALNPDGTRYGYRASATYIDQFADDTLGIAIGFSATSAPSQNERYNAWGFPNAPEAGGALLLGGAKPFVQSNELERYGAVGTLEYEPSEDFHATLDVLYSKFKETQRLRGIEFPINPGWGSGATLGSFTVEDGFVTEATLTGIDAVQRNDLNKRDAENLSLGLNTVLALGDTTKLTVDASWSRATRTDFLLETYTGSGYATSGPDDTIRISQNRNGTFDIVPTLDYTNTAIFGITDPRGWGFNGTTAVVQAGFLNRPKFKDDLKALRASLDGEFENAGLLAGWEVGANYARRKKTSAFKSFFLCPVGGGTNCTVASGTPQFIPVPTDAILSKPVALGFLGVPAMLAYDPLYVYRNSLNAVFDNRPVSLVRDNTVTENVYTGYAMLKLDGDLGGKPVAGAIGVQVVHTDQGSKGTVSAFQDTNGDGINEVIVAPASGSTKYTDVLPSASLSVELLENTFVKLGASRTMVRPRLDQERINQEISFDFSRLTSTIPGDSFFRSRGGNFRLRPYESTNVDLSFERYFARSGYVALAVYFKDLSEFVDANNSALFDFSSAVQALPPALAAQVGTPIGRSSQPANNGNGYIFGQEATLSLPFANFTEALDGFGFFGSVSHTKSEVTLGSNPTQSITVPGLSKWVGTAEGYFEKNGFQARVSYRFRSKFLGEVAGLSANPEFRQARSEGILDAQIGYEFQEGSALAGLSVLLQAKNLTNRPFVTYANNDPRQVIDYQRYGRDYYLGLSYKF
jgi:iron complex outermembrane receptor protein